MIQISQLLPIGRIQKTHGTRGAVLCRLQDDAFFLAAPQWIILETEGLLVPFKVEEYRSKGSDVLLQLTDVNTETAAGRYIGCQVYMQLSDLPEDYEPPFSVDSLLHYQVVDAQQGALGSIIDIDDSTLNMLLLLDSGIVIPAHEDFIETVDDENRRLLVHLPEGLVVDN